MSLKRKNVLCACIFAVGIAAFFAWPSLQKPKYQGQTMEEWFNTAYEISSRIRSFEADKVEMHRVGPAFRHFDTNAVPYLAGRITQDFADSKLDKWLMKIRDASPQSLKRLAPPPKAKGLEALIAIDILSGHFRPNSNQLLPLLQPALHSTNHIQRASAVVALRSIGGSKEKAWPYVLKALEDSEPVVSLNADWMITNFTHEAAQSLPEILRIAGATNASGASAIMALLWLGTNASAAIPQLEQMLNSETDEIRREIISAALSSVRGTPIPSEPK